MDSTERAFWEIIDQEYSKEEQEEWRIATDIDMGVRKDEGW